MLVAAIKSLASQSPALKNPDKPLLPDVEDVRKISAQIACAVIKQAVEEGLNRVQDIPIDDDEDLLDWVQMQMWDPAYRLVTLITFLGEMSLSNVLLGH